MNANALLATAEEFVIDRVLNTDVQFRSKNRAWLVFLAVSGFMLAVGLGFVVYGAYLWLSMHTTPDVAAFSTGGLILFLAVISALCAYMLVQYKREKLKKLRTELTHTMQTALDLADDELGEPIREHPKTAVLVAALAGFLTGERFL